MLNPGNLLHDRYRIRHQIGKGGMGAVYEAIDLRLQNTVAVKQTSAGGAGTDSAFEREAMLLAALRHPALPVVIDYFFDEAGPCLVMQFIEGEDLGRLLARQGGPFPTDKVLAWALAVLDALCYLHGRVPPIVHRDIKPANLKLTPSGEIVLLDFGLAKRRLVTDPTTEASMLGFTLAYAPPEQIDGRGTDLRSDVYALGATLYHLLTGIPSPNAMERAMCMAGGLPDPVRNILLVNSEVSPALSAVVSRAMALDPLERFESAHQMRAALFQDETVSVQPRKKSGPSAASRRIDAAAPSRAEVQRQIDLIVQVRFHDSPLLDFEDWPTSKPPGEIEQVSEQLRLVFPVDPRTGATLPARLRIRVVAPDFTLSGQAEQLVEVPPDDYSKRVAFLLTPQRPGHLRINVEVYGPDALYLGAIPIATEAVGASVAQPAVHVANLVLEVLARQVADILEKGADTDEQPSIPAHLPKELPIAPASRAPSSWMKSGLKVMAPGLIIAMLMLSVFVFLQMKSPTDMAQAPQQPPASAQKTAEDMDSMQGRLLIAANMLRSEGNHADALATVNKVLEQNPNHETALALRSAIETELAAKNELSQEKMINAWLAKVPELIRAGRFQEAAAELQKIQQIQPGNSQTLRLRTQLEQAIARQNTTEAEMKGTPAERQQPSAPSAEDRESSRQKIIDRETTRLWKVQHEHSGVFAGSCSGEVRINGFQVEYRPETLEAHRDVIPFHVLALKSDGDSIELIDSRSNRTWQKFIVADPSRVKEIEQWWADLEKLK